MSPAIIFAGRVVRRETGQKFISVCKSRDQNFFPLALEHRKLISTVIRCFGRSILAGSYKLCTKFYMPMECEKVRGNEFMLSPQFLKLYDPTYTTKVLALPARSEQYGLFLTPNDWTIYVFFKPEFSDYRSQQLQLATAIQSFDSKQKKIAFERINFSFIVQTPCYSYPIMCLRRRRIFPSGDSL